MSLPFVDISKKIHNDGNVECVTGKRSSNDIHSPSPTKKARIEKDENTSGVSDACPSPNTTTRTGRPSAVLTEELAAFLEISAPPAPTGVPAMCDTATDEKTNTNDNKGPVIVSFGSNIGICYAPSSEALRALLNDTSSVCVYSPCAAAHSSAVVVVVAADVKEILRAHGTKEPTVELLCAMTSGLIDDSFFIIKEGAPVDAPRPITASLNAVPIIICSIHDDASILETLQQTGALGPYLQHYFGEKPQGEDDEHGPAPIFSAETLPCAAMFTSVFNNSNNNDSSVSLTLERVTQKVSVSSPGVLHSMCLAAPVHTVADLLRELRRTMNMSQCPSVAYMYRGGFSRLVQKNGSSVNTTSTTTSSSNDKCYALLYAGASWCPPCLRILKELPSMLTGLQCAPVSILTEENKKDEKSTAPFAPALVGNSGDTEDPRAAVRSDVPAPSTVSFLKADYDTSPEVLRLFNITTIPTFVVLDLNAIASSAGKTEAEVLTGAVVGTLQNSQRATVTAFLDRHCGAPLTFGADDDF